MTDSVPALLPPHCYGERAPDAVIDTVMLHFCSYVEYDRDRPYDLDAVRALFTELGVSAHYIIDRDGTVHRLAPEEKKAYHAGKGCLPDAPQRENALNDYTIGIEMLAIGSESDMLPYITKAQYAALPVECIGYTAAQYSALRVLLEDICRRYPAIGYHRTHIIGHDDYAPGRKTDPGELFDWQRIGLPAERL